MQQTSETYKQLRSQIGSYYEVEVECNGIVYGMDKLKSIHISSALFDGNGPQIGGVHSSQCELKLIEDSANWPRMAEFEVRVRITDGEIYDEDWLTLGTFFTDERRKDKFGNLYITAFDSMLSYDVPWTDKVEELPETWPVTAHAACEMLSEAVGIVFDNLDDIDDSVPYIGLNTTSTARDVLSQVAVGCGGNFFVTPDGKLRLIGLRNRSMQTSAIAGIAIAGIAVVGTEGYASHINPGYFDIGLSASDIQISDPLDGIGAVEITTDGGTTATQKYSEGYTLKADCDFASSRITESILPKVFQYTYRPFEATQARLDPAAELGDQIAVDGESYEIIAVNWNIAPHIVADVSAPYDEEVDHEYTFVSESAKTLRKAIGYTDGQIEQTRSYIEQTEQSITQGIATSYVQNDVLNQTLQNYSPTSVIEEQYYNKSESDEQIGALASEVVLQNNSLTIAMSELRADTEASFDAMTYYIRYEDGVVIIGRTDKPTSVRISNEKISLYYNEEEISYWDQNKQYTPHELEIPTGGKFTLGKILFQPRSSGNMSLMWVN